MADGKGQSVRQIPDSSLFDRLRSILLNAAQGQRSVSDDRQYPALRKELFRRKLGTPPMVSTHPNLDSFVAFIKGIETRQERSERVRIEFALLASANDDPLSANASSWTGVQSRAAKLQTLKTMLPLAQTAVEGLIAFLSEPGANGGPILDNRAEAIEHLRALHRTLGSLLSSIDGGGFDDELGEGLAAEAARWGKRAVTTLADDPMPYLASGLLVGLLGACGFPGVGSFLGDVALGVKKNSKKL
jgi:hypothetical protein